MCAFAAFSYESRLIALKRKHYFETVKAK